MCDVDDVKHCSAFFYSAFFSRLRQTSPPRSSWWFSCRSGESRRGPRFTHKPVEWDRRAWTHRKRCNWNKTTGPYGASGSTGKLNIGILCLFERETARQQPFPHRCKCELGVANVALLQSFPFWRRRLGDALSRGDVLLPFRLQQHAFCIRRLEGVDDGFECCYFSRHRTQHHERRHGVWRLLGKGMTCAHNLTAIGKDRNTTQTHTHAGKATGALD